MSCETSNVQIQDLLRESAGKPSRQGASTDRSYSSPGLVGRAPHPARTPSDSRRGGPLGHPEGPGRVSGPAQGRHPRPAPRRIRRPATNPRASGRCGLPDGPCLGRQSRAPSATSGSQGAGSSVRAGGAGQGGRKGGGGRAPKAHRPAGRGAGPRDGETERRGGEEGLFTDNRPLTCASPLRRAAPLPRGAPVARSPRGSAPPPPPLQNCRAVSFLELRSFHEKCRPDTDEVSTKYAS